MLNVFIASHSSSMHCPKCNCNFKSQKALLSHMNQPQSMCFSHFSEILSLADDLERFNVHSQRQFNVGTSDTEEPMDLDSAMDSNDPPIEVDIERMGEVVIEEYNGASVHRSSPMDQ